MPANERSKSFVVAGLEGLLVHGKHSSAPVGGAFVPYPVLGLTRKGCYLDGPAPASVQSVKFLIEGREKFARKCTFARMDTPLGNVALRFDKELTDRDLIRLGAPLDAGGTGDPLEYLAAAREDYRAVSSDIDSIQKCRSRIFVATTGTITVAAFTIWGTHLNSPLKAYALCTGMAGVFAVFAVGVVTMVGKGRAINARRGFLAALVPYVTGDREFKHYRGWALLQHCLAECRSLRRARLCGRKLDYKSVRSCRDEGEATAAHINSCRRLVPRTLDSFTSLSAMFYTIAYFGFMALFGFTFAVASKQYWDAMEVSTFFWLFLLGAICISFLYRWLTVVAWVAVIAGIIVFLVARTAVWGDFLGGITSAFGAGALLGSLGWYLSAQLYALRLGKYSFETNAYGWGCALEHCDPLPQAELLRNGPILTRGDSWWERVCGWVRATWLANVSQRAPQKVADDFENARESKES